MTEYIPGNIVAITDEALRDFRNFRGLVDFHGRNEFKVTETTDTPSGPAIKLEIDPKCPDLVGACVPHYSVDYFRIVRQS